MAQRRPELRDIVDSSEFSDRKVPCVIRNLSSLLCNIIRIIHIFGILTAEELTPVQIEDL